MVSVVVPAFRIPDERRNNFFDWNREQFLKQGVKVILVSDQKYDVPDFAECLVYPEKLDVFHLSAVCNYGIRHAGEGLVIKTDIDCIFTREMFEHDLIIVQPGDLLFWYYWLARDAESLDSASVWPQGRGTVAMGRDDWERVCGYNENMIGYGIEDGDLCRRTTAAGIKHYRGQAKLYHVQHGINGDRGFWNRDEFNPANHDYNLEQDGNWKNANWGKPTFRPQGAP